MFHWRFRENFLSQFGGIIAFLQIQSQEEEEEEEEDDDDDGAAEDADAERATRA